MDERRIEFPTIEDNRTLFREEEQILGPEVYSSRFVARLSIPSPVAVGRSNGPTARWIGFRIQK